LSSAFWNFFGSARAQSAVQDEMLTSSVTPEACAQRAEPSAVAPTLSSRFAPSFSVMTTVAAGLSSPRSAGVFPASAKSLALSPLYARRKSFTFASSNRSMSFAAPPFAGLNVPFQASPLFVNENDPCSLSIVAALTAVSSNLNTVVSRQPLTSRS
jgi:hypothetical protein